MCCYARLLASHGPQRVVAKCMQSRTTADRSAAWATAEAAVFHNEAAAFHNETAAWAEEFPDD